MYTTRKKRKFLVISTSDVNELILILFQLICFDKQLEAGIYLKGDTKCNTLEDLI